MTDHPSLPAADIDAVAAADPVTTDGYVHVYRGRLAGSDEAVRLLVLSPAGADARSVREAFVRASEQWERLGTHSTVVTVCARGTTPRPWLAVEAVDGEHLGTVGPALSTAAVRSVVADAAEALHHAARAGLHHGGLSPDQVWVCRGDAGVDGRVDWNVERACRVAAGEALTSPYTAPEQADAPAAPTPAADVYALGAIIYEVTTGNPAAGPFVRDRPPDERGFQAPSALDPGLSPRLDAVVSTAMDVDPSARYPSAYAFKLAVLFDAGGAGDSPTPAAAGFPAAGGARPAGGTTDWSPGQDATDPGLDRDPGTGEDTGSVTGASGPTRRAALGVLGVAVLGGGLLAAGRLDDDRTDDPSGGGDPSTTDDEAEAVRLEPPDADFEFTYEDGSLTITHAGGDAVGAGNLVIRSAPLQEPLRWSDAGAYGAEDRITAGDSLTVDIPPPTPAIIRWEHGDRAELLANFEPPQEVDPPVVVEPPQASFAIEYDGEAVTVSHETGEAVSATRLQFRGSGFAAAPAARWNEATGVGQDAVVEPGTAVQFDASDEAVVHLFWKPETRDSAALDSSRQVVLAQFSGPARPLDPDVGGATMGQYDAANTGFGRDVSGPADGAVARWLFDTQPTAGSGSFSFAPLSPSPVVSGGIVYAGGNDDNFYAVDAVDGTELWRAEAGPLSAGSVADGTVYVAGLDLAALDAADGSGTWLFETDGRFLGSPKVAGGTVYVASGEPFEWAVHAVDGENGRERWRVTIEDGIVRTPAVADDAVYVSAETVRAHARADGSERWGREFGTVPTAPAVADGTVYVGETAEEQGRGFVSALDRTDGTERWRQGVPGALRSSVAVADGTVYAAGGTGTDGFVSALDAATGETQWAHQLDGPANNSPVVADGTVYVADSRRHVVALDAATGRERWQHGAADEFLGSPVVANDTLYVVGRKHSLHAIDAIEVVLTDS